MALSVKHNTLSTKPATANSRDIDGPIWNEEHTLTATAGTLLGAHTSGSGEVAEVTLGDNLTMSTSGVLSASLGSGAISAIGTPVDNQVGVWTSATGIEGDADFTWDGTTLTVSGELAGVTSLDATTNSTISAAVTITESQISDLGSYISGITNEDLGDLSDVVLSGAASGQYLSFNGTNWVNRSFLAGDISGGTLADARVAESNVTQHEAALTITESQISDLGSYLVTTNNLSDLTDASAARTNLGVDAAGTDNSTDVTLAGQNYLSLTGQQITAGTIDLASHVNNNLPINRLDGGANAGATTFWRGDGTWATLGSTSGDVTYSGSPTNNYLAHWTAEGDITGDSGLQWNGSTLTVTGGLAGVTSIDATTENTLEAALDTLPNLTITESQISDLGNYYEVAGTDVALADGGTGASLTDPNADRIMFWDDSAGAVTWLVPSTGLTLSGTNLTVRTSSTTQTGIVELATTEETQTGTDTARAITPAGAAATYQPLDADLTALAAAGNSSVLAATTASFLTTDETKLDNIEALADVTDTANVTAAGALMDSELADITAIKTLQAPDNTTISTFGASLIDDASASAARTTLGVDAAGTDNSTPVTFAGTGTYLSLAGQQITVDPITESDISDLGSYIESVLEDTTPQLGGNLDVNGNSIVSSSSGNINITPNGTGNVSLGTLTFNADQTVGAGQDNYVLTYDHAAGVINLETVPAGGSVTLDDITDVTITSVASGEILSYTGAGWENRTLAEANISAVGHTHTESDISDLGTTILLTTDLGSSVQAYDADTLKADVADQLTAGYTAAVDDDGTKSSGTYTPSVAAGSNYKKIVNGGAFTLAPPTLATNEATTISLFIQNGGSSGAITTSGFTKVTGDDFTTTSTDEFLCRIEVFDIGGTEYSMLDVVAMQ